MKYLISKKNRGFTLVELMVAVAVFSIVMVTAASALLNVIEANRKAQAIKTAINNINFALEAISKDMRVGTEYECLDEDFNKINPDGNCGVSGGVAIRYRSVQAGDDTGNKKLYAYYYFDNKTTGPNSRSIMGCVEDNANDCSNYDANYSRLTSEEIAITSARFYVVGNTAPGVSPKLQPRMVMTLTGKVNEGKKTETEFNLQTSVSQRARILQQN
jgi:prepilin-type N-terminal cleavage/methylation domain-containing protein